MTSLRAQTTDRVLMIRPAAFGFNAETAESNALQRPDGLPAVGVADAAGREFDAFVRQLRAEGVDVVIGDDTPSPAKPDAVFPNNWVSFHADGTIVLYPMLAPNRRCERRAELVDRAVAASGYVRRRTIDLSSHEKAGRFLEGTGSLILDHVARVAYASVSPRTDAGLAQLWCDEMQFDCETFAALDSRGRPYYHTNVILSIGSRYAVLASEALPAADRERVRARLAATGRDVIEIDRRQVDEFCGNLLELATWDEALGDSSVLVMSQRARAAFTADQMARLECAVDTIIAAPLPTIEGIGGGGARCMLAEIFLPA